MNQCNIERVKEWNNERIKKLKKVRSKERQTERKQGSKGDK